MKTETTTEATTTVQATSKHWKGAKLLGVVLFIGGFMVPPEMPNVIGALLGAGGILIFLYGMIGGWWNHA